MEHVRNRQAEKRRDLARSTCSPLGSVARAVRKAKRNANRRERRAQKASLIAVRKAPCLCDEDRDHCPRCDQEMSHFGVETSRPKTYPWHYHAHCFEYRWAWDKFSQIYRWAEARDAALSRSELLKEIHSLGRRPAHTHAIFHLLMDYSPSHTGKAAPPKMTVAALTSALRERGLEYCERPERLLTTIAERICTHGKFAAANQWSFELCQGLYVDVEGVRNQRLWWERHNTKLHMRHLDAGWWLDRDDQIGYRPLWGIHDAAAWAAEIQRLFDVFWGPRFLETPEGRWVICELVTEAIPKLGETLIGVIA
jgi:hypothetical protein